MPTLELPIYRDLPCECLALTDAPWPECPCCGGEGSYEHEVIATVEYCYHPPSRGARNRWGVPLEPDENADAEIVSSDVELTRMEEDWAIDRACEDMAERAMAALEAACEARAEMRRGW